MYWVAANQQPGQDSTGPSEGRPTAHDGTVLASFLSSWLARHRQLLLATELDAAVHRQPAHWPTWDSSVLPMLYAGQLHGALPRASHLAQVSRFACSKHSSAMVAASGMLQAVVSSLNSSSSSSLLEKWE